MFVKRAREKIYTPFDDFKIAPLQTEIWLPELSLTY